MQAMIFVLTIMSCQRDELGLYLQPGLAIEELEFRTELKRLKPGAALELQLPDGGTQGATLLAFGIPALRLADGSAMVSLTDAIHLTIGCRLEPEALPAGTELWWLQEAVRFSAGRTDRE